MNNIPYKYHLYHFQNRQSKSYSKNFFSFLGLFALIAIGIFSVLFYQYQKDAPFRDQRAYLKIINSGFTPTEQSLTELLDGFNVAGAKVEIVNSLEGSQNPQEGFFISLNDIETTLQQIESTQKNIAAKKEILENSIPPQGMEDLRMQVLTFYSDSQEKLEGLHADFSFSKEMLLASGPNLYLPILANESLWKEGGEQEILAYYQNTQIEAQNTLSRLESITPPEEFKDYYDLQIEYLNLLLGISDKITKTLSNENPQEDSITNIEIAYQILTNAKNENEESSDKLAQEKLRLLDLKENLNKFADLEIQKNSIKEQIQNATLLIPPTQDFKFNFQTPIIPSGLRII